jgi:hypothetical protein
MIDDALLQLTGACPAFRTQFGAFDVAEIPFWPIGNDSIFIRGVRGARRGTSACVSNQPGGDGQV